MFFKIIKHTKPRSYKIEVRRGILNYLEIKDMMNKTLTFAAAITLTSALIAGGDDRDMGPVESFDSMQPVAEKTVLLSKRQNQ